MSAAHQGRNAFNATAIINNPSLGLNESFNTPGSLNIGTTSSKNGTKFLSNKFE